MNNQIVFIVGQYKHGEHPDIVWEFQGVFDSAEKAIAACKTDDYFVSLERVNQPIAHETVQISQDWGWFPSLEPMPKAVIEASGGSV